MSRWTSAGLSDRMAKVIFSMTVSLDGFIAGPAGEIDWSAPDAELHGFHNERTRELGLEVMGRRLYETMLYWETVDPESLSPEPAEFREIWNALPKLVFSKTLESVEGNATLVRDGVLDEVARLKREPGRDIAVGGAGLASSLIAAGLIDEYRLFIAPVILGGGTRFFPPLERRQDLELLETRLFPSRVVYVRCRVGNPAARHA